MTGTVNLELGASHVLPDTTAVIVNTGATLNLAGFHDTIASLMNSGTVRLGGSTLTSVGAVSSSGSIYGSGMIVAPTVSNTGALAPGSDILTVGGSVSTLSVAFHANGAVGTLVNPMPVAGAAQVEARASAGEVHITSVSSVTIGGASLGGLAGISASGAVRVTSGQHITITEGIAMPGDVTLAPTGNVIDGNGAAVNVAANLLTINGGAASGVDLDTAISHLAGTVNGTITIDEADGLTIQNVTVGAGGSVTITSATGDITVVALTAPRTVTLTASAGAILDGNAAETVNITAPTLTLSAATGIAVDVISTTLASASVTGGALQSRD